MITTLPYAIQCGQRCDENRAERQLVLFISDCLNDSVAKTSARRLATAVRSRARRSGDRFRIAENAAARLAPANAKHGCIATHIDT